MKPSFCKLYLWAGLFVLLMVSGASWAMEKEQEQEYGLQPIRPFSAELVEYNKHNPKIQKKIAVQMGKDGVRMTEMAFNGRKPEFIYIQNFQSQQEWIVAPSKLYYSALPVEESSFKEEDFSIEASDGAEAVNGVLNIEPCLGMKKQRYYEHKSKNALLTVWQCRQNSSEQTYLQHYSPLLGIVVRQESSNGHIFELRDIVLDPPDASLFEPSKLWREVTLEAFFTGAPSLPDYIEADLH